ncbi:uncharacterized protein LOC105227545 [Bactrocera dorsalis]|uniref:Uncharacterized protein LOC105227545 n=1 Tax=Bactrocera dorsalis TaxID=27457 RepID=A0A6I9VN14_BACDO|nr:uncharacterized protein LOC105227545 [Bactrocera dorsalis]
MSNKRFYNFPEMVSNDLHEENIPISVSNNNNIDEINEDHEDDSEFLQDVPYSSSSLDRSSIGSIPWADDAIKQNQLDWEQVERMLSSEEALPVEPDLRNEIIEWQTKFPQLLERKQTKEIVEKIVDDSKANNSLTQNIDDDLISHLSLNSSDDEDRYDELATPTTTEARRIETLEGQFLGRKSAISKSYADRLSAKMALLRVTAIPLRPKHRNDSIKVIRQQTSTDREHSSTSSSLRLRKISTSKPQSIMQSPALLHENTPFDTQHHFRMPPILNVLESKRRFRDLASNKSFVQLTQVKAPHAKSAAIIRQPENNLSIGHTPRATIFTGHHQTVWQKPLIANRVSSNFFNNRNAIILPSLHAKGISAQHQRRNSTTSSTGAGTRTQSLSNSNVGSSANSSGDFNLRPRNAVDRFVSRWQQINANTSTSTGTVSTGRSISAAVHHHARGEVGLRELYVPYNAFKHDGFK